MPKILVILLLLSLMVSACAGGNLVPNDPLPQTETPTMPALPAEATASPDDSVTSPAYPAPGPVYPAPGGAVDVEEGMERGEVFLEELGLVTLESFPPQYALKVSGNLPTPCHQFRYQVADPDQEKHIQVQVYSIYNPDEMCTQVLSPFSQTIQLGSFPKGEYTVFLNGQQAAMFQAP